MPWAPLDAAAATRGVLTPSLLLELQRHAGNQRLQRALLQRQTDAGVPAAGVTEPPATEPPKPTFTFVKQSQQGERFDSEYVPAGPAPAVGELNINLWVHIAYSNFTRAMMRQPDFRGHRWTPEQLADFQWTDAERDAFETGFMTSVQGVWSGKHQLHLNDPDFSEYRCGVNVNVVSISEPGLAHMKITAQKVPRGAPRFRSFVSGDTATLDIRDPTEPETHRVFDRAVVAQIGPFDRDRAELTPPILGQVKSVVDEMRPLQSPTETDKILGKDTSVALRGRSSSPGSEAHNEQLGLNRAHAVEGEIASELGRSGVAADVLDSVGEKNAGEDPSFQRVDVSVRRMAPGSPDGRVDVTQNVAAHEAGHMFGLGDEYVDEKPGPDVVPKFFGDKPEHYGDVEALVGADAANELAVQDGGSLMSSGGDVKRGHYVYFVQALDQLTGKHWQVE